MICRACPSLTNGHVDATASERLCLWSACARGRRVSACTSVGRVSVEACGRGKMMNDKSAENSSLSNEGSFRKR